MTSALVVALSVVVPLLDGDRVNPGPVFEAEHHGSSCVVVHDHTICTQFSANLSLIPDAPAVRRPPTPVRMAPPSAPEGPSAVTRNGTRLPRAPPSHRA